MSFNYIASAGGYANYSRARSGAKQVSTISIIPQFLYVEPLFKNCRSSIHRPPHLQGLGMLVMTNQTVHLQSHYLRVTLNPSIRLVLLGVSLSFQHTASDSDPSIFHRQEIPSSAIC